MQQALFKLSSKHNSTECIPVAGSKWYFWKFIKHLTSITEILCSKLPAVWIAVTGSRILEVFYLFIIITKPCSIKESWCYPEPLSEAPAVQGCINSSYRKMKTSVEWKVFWQDCISSDTASPKVIFHKWCIILQAEPSNMLWELRILEIQIFDNLPVPFLVFLMLHLYV